MSNLQARIERALNTYREANRAHLDKEFAGIGDLLFTGDDDGLFHGDEISPELRARVARALERFPNARQMGAKIADTFTNPVDFGNYSDTEFFLVLVAAVCNRDGSHSS